MPPKRPSAVRPAPFRISAASLPAPALLVAAVATLLFLSTPLRAQDHAHAGHAQLECVAPRGNVAERPSPYDSISGMVGSAMLKVCYGRPSARGRQFVGHDTHPFGEPWRFGADEATQLHVSAPVSVAGVSLGAGSYSLYVIPGPSEWEVVVNGNHNRWGIPINDAVRAADVGSGRVPVESLPSPVETFTLRLEPAGAGQAHLVAEWESWRIRIPIRATGE